MWNDFVQEHRLLFNENELYYGLCCAMLVVLGLLGVLCGAVAIAHIG